MSERIFKSERLYLRLLEAKDVTPRYVDFFNDKRMLRFYSGTIRNFDRESLLDDIRIGAETKIHFIYGIYTHENIIIGNIKVGPIISNHKISDLIIFLGDKSYHRKGYAEDAIRLGMKIAFEEHNIRKLFGGGYATNFPSIKAYLNAGWEIKGKREGYYLVNNKPVDQILIECANPSS